MMIWMAEEISPMVLFPMGVIHTHGADQDRGENVSEALGAGEGLFKTTFYLFS